MFGKQLIGAIEGGEQLLILTEDSWLLGRTTLTSVNSFQVVFEGIRGDDFHGDIAIDDVIITDGICTQPGRV